MFIRLDSVKRIDRQFVTIRYQLILFVVYLKCVAGADVAPAVLAPKCGPLGMPPKKVGDDIKAGTTAWAGIKVPVQVAVVNRQCVVTVLPSASSLVMKALKEPVRNRKTEKNVKHSGDITFAAICDIGKELEKAGKSMSKTLNGTVMQVLGTCKSIGCTVDKQDPKVIQAKIKAGELSAK